MAGTHGDENGRRGQGPATAATAWVAWVIAAAAGVAHFLENCAYVRHLLRVPDKGLAQAAALQTENGFYYSYYHELVEAESVTVGLEGIIWDRRSEYPDVLNALRRFNIYQEVILALAYRVLRACSLADVLDSWDFFRYTMLGVNGLGHSALSLLASEVSGNPFAGFACFLLAFLNRFQISRLGNYSSSNLRECWGIPLLWLQTLCLWRLLVKRPGATASNGRMAWWSFGFVTFVFIVSWQFSPFLLLLQASALYFVYLVCGFRDLLPIVSGVVDVYFLALGIAVVVHFGSPYLVTSPFLFQLVALKVSTTTRSWCCCVASRCGAAGGRRGQGDGAFSRRCAWRLCSWLVRRLADVSEGLLALAVFLAVRKAMEPFATADTHVYEILCTKVAAINDLLPRFIRLPKARMPECSEPSFNARLYLIMGVFNLLEASSLDVYRQSSAGALSLAAAALIVLRFVLGSFRTKGSCGDLAGRAAAPAALTPTAAAPSPAAAAAASATTPTEVFGGAPAAQSVRRRRVGGGGGKGDCGGGAAASGQAGAAEEEAEAVLVAGAAEAEVEALASASEYEEEEEAAEEAEEAALLFFVGQSLLFFGLGGLINRLRVAFGPPMMVLAASCFGPRLWPLPRLLRGRLRLPILAAIALLHCLYVAWLLLQMPCVNDREGMCNMFSDKSSQEGDLADLCDWINRSLDPSVPVLSSMNLAGSLRLFTGVPLIVHPQFESLNLRKRVQLGYELYQCGSEESFVQTMQRLHAEAVIFEYNRCFFTPYILDDRRKNCIKSKHKPEDQLCVKLHAQSHRFELLFANGGYALFRLRPAAPAAAAAAAAATAATPAALAPGGAKKPWQPPLEDDEPSPAKVKSVLANPDTWSSYVARCAAEQGEVCGARLMELAATWHHSLKRPEVARTLRTLAGRRFPDDGYVNYYLGRHLDYDAQGGQDQAGAYYAKAVAKLPDNTVMLKEYIMWLDIVSKDSERVRKLLEERRGQKRRRGRPRPLLLQRGSGAGGLLCEAAVSARNLDMKAWGNELWARAMVLAPFSDCVKNNWPMIHGESSNFSDVFTTWDKVRWLLAGGVQHDVQSHNQPNVRFLADDRPFLTNPFATRRAAANMTAAGRKSPL